MDSRAAMSKAQTTGSLLPRLSLRETAADPSALRIFFFFLLRVPLFIQVAIHHLLGRSKPSRYVSLTSELKITAIREFMRFPAPWSVTMAQRLSMSDTGIRGKIWVSTYTSPVPPETDVRDTLMRVISEMGTSGGQAVAPALVGVEAEWTGYRAGASGWSAQPKMSERGKYDEMLKEVTHPTTILHIHGGAFYLGDPCAHRPTHRKLAQLTGGKVYAVRYRLAPQDPFPTGLLDCLVSYLTLLYPPPGAFHDAVSPEHLVLSGDSAGGNLALSLTQVLVYLREAKQGITWYGQLRNVPLPAAICANSPWTDITQTATTIEGQKYAPFDLLPQYGPIDWSQVPPCPRWPASPPRQHLYVNDDLVTHPLVSPIVADTASWADCPPVYICTGWEILGLEQRYLAQRLVEARVKVRLDVFEGMPHAFALVLGGTREAETCYERWADFIRTATEGRGGMESKAHSLEARSLTVRFERFEDLCDITEQDMRQRIAAHVQRVH